jgi:hypothetical protein
MALVIFACDKIVPNTWNELDRTYLYPGDQVSGHASEAPLNKYLTLTLALPNYMKPNEDKSYYIFKKSILKEAIYWAPRWHSVYTSDKHRYYYDSNKSVAHNLNRWIGVYRDTLSDYNPEFTYNEIGIPQNEIVFDKPIDLDKYVEWVIY